MITTVHCSPVGYALPKTKYNFTPDQQRLIEEYHKFIFVWLKKKGLDFNEYYDIVVFAFLSGIQKYDPNHPRANILSLLWCEMSKAVYSYRLFEKREKRRAFNYAFSLEPQDEHGHYYSYPLASKYNLEKHVELRLLFDKLLYGDVLNPIQTAFIKYILCGYSDYSAMRKISSQTKINYHEIKWQIKTMRVMLKSYVRYGV